MIFDPQNFQILEFSHGLGSVGSALGITYLSGKEVVRQQSKMLEREKHSRGQSLTAYCTAKGMTYQTLKIDFP